MKIFLRSLLLVITLVISNAVIAQKLYWVGGSGQFNDPAHWSYENNGLGGIKTPTINDDVYFDENSFRGTSIIDIIGGASCHDLIFTDNTAPVILNGTQNEKLTISGNAKFNAYVTNSFKGETHLTSSQNNTSVMFSNSKISGNLFFDGNTTWNLETLLGSDNSIFYFNAGKVNLNHGSIFTGSMIVNNNVIIDGTQSVLNVKNKLWFNNGALLIDHGVYIEASLTDPTKYSLGNNQIPSNRLVNNNNSTLACAFTFTLASAPQCAATCDGIVSFTIPAACASPFPYTATWIPGSGSCSAPAGTPAIISSAGVYTQNNVCGCGVAYTVLFADNLGNFAGSASVPVTAPSPITAFLSPVKPLCNGDCNGKISAIIVGGTQPYTLKWSPGPTHTNNFGSDSITNLCVPPTFYSVVITDSHNCKDSLTATMTQPTVIAPNGSVKAPLCSGVCNGLAIVAPTGGTPFTATQSNGIKYTTVWDGNAALNNDTLAGLCSATTHTCVITDKNGCTVTYTVVVPAAPLPVTFTQTNNSPLNCFNVCNGILSITASGGTTPYTFSWTPSGASIVNAGNTSTNSNLCAGNYSCTVKDANGCTAQATYTITSPPAITHTLTAINPKCNGQTSGSIKDSVSGGTSTPSGYTFTWTPSGSITNTSSSSTNSNLGPGSYSVVLTDSKGCKDTARATLTNPPAITATITPTNPTCFGSTDGKICVTAAGGTGSVYTYSWTPVEPSTACITGLGAGSYTAIVSDSNHCTKIVSTTLIAPTQINISVVKINPTCSNLCNGSATVTASGGSGSGYTYSWSCAAGNTSTVLSGQCGGTSCTVTVKDGNNCTQTKVITFTNPNPLSVSMSATPLVCANQCNSQITTNVIGGTPTYTYSWFGTGVCSGCSGQSGMCAGNYSVIVTDSNNCTATANVTVAAPNPIVITATPINPTCFNTCDGSISASISGGATPYTFGWNPSIVPNTLTPNNLCAGSYTLTGIDANGCTATQTVTLINPASVTGSVISTSVTCAGSCNGTATVTALGGTGVYQYSWDGAAYSASTSTTSLCAGTHTVQIKDANGCTAAAVIYTIAQPTALTAAVTNITKSCLNICNGTATASASGGTPNYTYSWDVAGGPFTNVTNTSILCIGTHTLYVKDANGCTASTVFNVQVIINVNILANSLSVSCHNVCDGSASATASGGIGPYTFSWTPNPNPVPNCTNVASCTANNLCPGTYTVLVTDQTGCASEDSITILNPPILTASVNVINATCFGVCNGSATVTPAGGTGPYTEQWSNNGIIGPNPAGLCPGTYTATVVDNRGCTVSNPIVIGSSPQFTVVPTVSSPTACVTSTGSISLAITGGSGTYTVNWSNPPGGTGTVKTGLAAGIYTATITDSNGCDTTLTIGLSDPTGPTASVIINQNVSCHGSCDGSATVSGTGVNPINIFWTTGTPNGLSPVTDNVLCAGNYPVQVIDGNHCVTIENVLITQPTIIKDSAVITPLTCSSGNTGVIVLHPSGGGGPTYSFTINGVTIANPITNLSAGIQTVTITDGTHCSATYTYNINVPTPLVITVTKTNELCAGACNGTAQAGVTGGTAAYTYTWTNSLGAVVSNNPNVAGLCPGTYTLNIKDHNNCTGQTVVVINAASPILPNLVTQNNNCNTGCTGAATVTPTGGSGGGFTYSWNTVGSPTTTTVNSVCPGNYFVTITDTNHCAVTTNFTLTAPPTVTASVVYTRPTCFGGATGSATVTPSGGTPSYTVTWSSGGCVGCVATNSLTAGSYVAMVTDSKGCSGSVSFTITDTTKLNANTTPTNPLCNNKCNGSILSAPVGGNGGYIYQWQGITPTPVGNLASNLCAPNTYTLIVIDSKNCRDTAHVTLTNPPAITLTESQSAATCGQNNGSVSISTVTPTGTLAVNWLAPSSSCGSNPNCTNLGAGIYSVTLTDANGCRDTFQIGITNSNGPLAVSTSTNVTCFGSCNGVASVANVTGNPTFTYSWSPSVTASGTPTSSIATGLCSTSPGPIYISTITDGLGCKALTTFSISSPPQIMDNPTIVNATCAGINNGSITSHGSGGTPFAAGYLYSIGGAFTTNNIFTGLGVGTHIITIKDSLGCTNTFTYTINGSTVIISSITSTNNLCFGACNATASLSNVNGGAPPYIITWNDPAGQAGPLAINLCAGSYTATITDTMGCKVTQVANITAPTTSVSPNYTVTSPACGLCNGAISLTPSGGTGPAYTYTWNTSNTTPSITNVCAGLYQVDITDAANCKTTYQIPVSNSSAPTAVITSTNVTCGETCNGAASVAASAGTAPYTYNWVSPTATTPSISSLCAGTYYVQVKDAANCVQTQSVTITAPTPIVLNQTVTPTDCGKCNGVVNIAPTGGTGTLSYTWNGVAATFPQTNLCAGSYTLVVSDVTCSVTTLINVNSSNAPLVSLSTTNPTCAGLNNGTATATIIGGTPPVSTIWSNGTLVNPATNLGAGTYNIIVQDNNLCASVQSFTITSPTPIALSLNNTQLPSCTNVCNGLLTAIPSGGTLPYTYTWTPVASNQDTIGHLCAGSYTVNVTDANGCAISQISTLVNNPFLISANPTIVQPSCAQCNGSITLAPSGGSGSYTYTWTTTPINSAPIQTNVCPGLYQVDITDGIGCKQTVSIPVSSSNSPTVSVSATNVTCSGLSNGSATATATGGILPYIFNWPAIPSTNTVVTGLNANTYYVQVKDSAGCIATQSVSITEPTALNANATMTSPTSCTVCDGSISTAVTGGSGSYTYSWSTGASTPNITNACAGIYTLVVTDGVTNCKDTLSPMGLNSPTGPSLTIASTDQKCFGVCNGSATVTATGGAGGYSYTWTPTGGNANIASGLCATQSPFMVEVSDNNGCIQTQSVTINEPTQLIASLPTITEPKCLNNTNGAINTVVSGGTPAYTYSWNPSTLSGTNPQNLGAGVYTYTVTDVNGCSITQTATLIDNLLVINPNATITKPTCAQCDGAILLAPSGGTGAYTYTWTTPSNANPLTNVCAGIYQVAITDAIGCLQTVQIPVSSSNSPTLAVTTTSVSCFGLHNGSATASATGGILPYIFSWPAIPSSNPVQTGLGVGTYYVQVKDSAGCIATQSVTIAQPTALIANATMVSPTSCTVCDGSISTSVTGGSGSYTYSWSTGASTPNITNACAGVYTLVVTDGVTNCKDTLLSMGLNSPTGPSLTIVSSDEKCFGDCNGTATVTATGGTVGYTYSWTPSGGNLATATTLCVNSYFVAVTDGAGCIQTQSVTINQPTKLITSLPTISPVKCFNDANGSINTVVSGGTPVYTYAWNPATATGANPQNLGAGVYSLTVTDANNCINTSEIDTLTNPTKLALTGTTTPASCNNTADGSIITTTSGGTPGYTWLWSNGSVNPNLTAILPNTYSVMAMDSHGCMFDTTFSVISTITITVNAGRDTSICNAASVVLTGTVTGSTTYNWQDISGTPIPPANTLTVSVNPTSVTQYVLIATNSGCTNSDTVQVSISPIAVANAGPDQSIISGQGINIGGNPTNPGGGTIVWSPYVNLTDTSATNPVASPTLTTTYFVVVTNSAGCKAKDSMVVVVLPPFDIPNGFTPNGDGKNDTWMLDNLYKFPNAEVEVYNRWGEQLFYSRGNYQAWNGNYNGSPVPVGTYYYIIKLNDKNYPDHYAGPLTILR